MLETPQITKTTEQSTAIIHLTIPRTEIHQAMGPGITEVMSAVAAQGIIPTGPLFSHHLRMQPDIFDFEIGVPVDQEVSDAGRVRGGSLPAGKVARTLYVGSYEGLSAAWGEFEAWIADQGFTPRADLWERYIVGPDSGSDPNEYCTELNRPLEG